MLNLEQQQAVRATDGPVRIIAGAGTGKTHTLISRIAYLIEEKKADPRKILALTFTNKAAHELNQRLQKKDLPLVDAMTFHALAARLLRQFWNPDFKILTPKEQEEILKELIGDRDDWKETLADIEKIRNQTEGRDDHPGMNEIIDKYHERLADQNALDFTGLLTTLPELWDSHPDTLSACQSLYHYLMVDEYQDVNPLQITIMRQLAGPHRNLCVVGDPDQTIYSWRGSQADSMADFENLYPDTISVTLTKNYRNPPALLKGAESLIAKNPGRLKKELKPVSAKTTGITLWESNTDFHRSEMLFHLLEKWIGSHSAMHRADELDVGREEGFRKLSDIAVLYRTKGEGKKLYADLSKRGYPCQLSAPESFWQKKVIVDFMEGLDNLRQWSAIETDQKFSKWLREKITKFIEAEDLTRAKINRLSHLIPHAMAFDCLPVSEALTQFLDEVRLQQDADNLVQADRISLLTLHAAKGLEFPIVLIMGLEEDNLPHKKIKDDPYWLAEERRLMYVGMTRATEELHLFRTQKKESRSLKPSRFLEEIGSENMTSGAMPEVKIEQIRKREIKKAQMKLF